MVSMSERSPISARTGKLRRPNALILEFVAFADSASMSATAMSAPALASSIAVA